MTVVVSPSSGAGVGFTQLGTGSSPGYSAIDVRRGDSVGLNEAPLSMGSYVVSQRGAGANMSVDIAASTGLGLLVQGDGITAQGVYRVAPHSAVINETIAAADATNPRIDSVICEVKDSQIDASGLNQAQTRVITGTPIAAVTLEAPGASPGALPNTAILLAYVLVPAGSSSVTTANIKDMRPKKRGKLNIATSESTSATSYAFNNLATPDRITQVVVPADALLLVGYQALFQATVASNAKAALFIGSNQVKVVPGGGGAPAVQEATSGATTASDYSLATTPIGLTSHGTAGESEVTTGQILGVNTNTGGALMPVFVAAGTYDVSIQYKNVAVGTLTASKRHLWVEVRDYDQCQAS